MDGTASRSNTTTRAPGTISTRSDEEYEARKAKDSSAKERRRKKYEELKKEFEK